MSNISVIALVIEAVVLTSSVIWLIYFRRRESIYKNIELSDNGEFVKWLQTYEEWYTTSSYRISITLQICRIGPIFLGFLVAIVSALKDAPFPDWLPENVLVIILTGLSTVCVALVTQLSLPELEKAREDGRRACAEFVARAQLFFSIQRNPDETLAEKIVIKDELFELESEQSTVYYWIFSSAPRSTNGPVEERDGEGQPGGKQSKRGRPQGSAAGR